MILSMDHRSAIEPQVDRAAAIDAGRVVMSAQKRSPPDRMTAAPSSRAQ